ncbi:unnamed protein product [Lathyrus oleraceus]
MKERLKVLQEETKRFLQQVRERVQKEQERLIEVERKKENGEEYERISMKCTCDMLERLSLLNLLNQTNLNQLDIQEKVMDGTSTKENCSIHQDNIEITPQQIDNIQRLKMIVESLPDICENI